jgi:outer membrane lipoprotein-sorting protein
VTRDACHLPGLLSARVVSIALATALLAGCARQSGRAERLLAQTAATYGGLKSFSETTTIRSSDGGPSGKTSTVTKTRFDYRAPNLVRYEKTGDNARVWICDGKKLITFDPVRKTYQEREAPPDLATFFRIARFGSPGINELALLINRDWRGALTRLRIGRQERIGGVETQSLSGVIAALSAQGAGRTEARQTIWVDPRTHLIRRNLVVVRTQERTMEQDEVMRQVKVNPALPDGHFAWSPPPGARPAPRYAPLSASPPPGAGWQP